MSYEVSVVKCGSYDEAQVRKAVEESLSPLGGLGSIPGVMLGSVLFALVDVLVGISPLAPLKDGVAFAMLALILVFRPTGIAGKAFY